MIDESAEAFDWVASYGIVHPSKRSFLSAYSQGHTVESACDVAKVCRQTHYDWLKHEHDEKDAYIAAYAEAQERRFNVLELEARRRAVEGVIERTDFDKEGNIVSQVKKYSDALLQFLMRGHKPEVYRDNHHVEHSGNVNFTADFDAALSRARARAGLQE